MKQKIALLFTALFLIGFANAQVSKESYEKSVDFLNCKTVELSLKDDKNLLEFQKKCPCATTTYTQINQFLTSVKLDATTALSNEVEGLKSSFKENWKKEDIVSFLSDGIFNDKVKFQKIFAFAEKRKGKPEFDTYKASLNSELTNFLIENVSQDNIPQISASGQQSSLEDRVAILEKNSQDKEGKSWFSGITSQIIVVSFLISLLFLLLTFFLFSRLFKNNDTEISNDIKNYVKREIDEVNFNRNTSNNNFNSSEIKDINGRIRDLELQVKNLYDKLQSNNSSGTISTPQPTYQEVKQPEVKSEIFFLSSPNADGSFDESSASSTYKEGATIYRFTKTGNNKANFQIDDKEASIKLALQYRDRRIDPVCETTNAFNQAKNISTVQQGEAELQSGKWIVNKKAKIRYEN